MLATVSRATTFCYRYGAKPILFQCDPERTHDWFLDIGRRLGSHPWAQRILARSYAYEHPALVQRVAGILFPNPIGLAAGFDKNGWLTGVIPSIGFGFMEVGSVTARPCAGNPKPRLWRLPESGALQVYYGLANDGAAAVAARIPSKPHAIPIGMSVAKTNSAATVDRRAGVADYVAGIRVAAGVGDYLTVNVSCPNAFGGEPFTTPNALDALLAEVDALAVYEPVFLKFPCDLDGDAFDALLAVAAAHRVAGIIISNLTKEYRGIARGDRARLQTRGGISGKPVAARANALIARTYRAYDDRFVIVGCGGVFTADDAYEKIRLGASLIQLITGMVYQGPSAIGQIAAGLVERLRRDGHRTIGDAVGTAAHLP
jgi:dihydroorotate dehydrogenase (fumarate)